jgi:hypothetical protein
LQGFKCDGGQSKSGAIDAISSDTEFAINVTDSLHADELNEGFPQ